MVIQPVIPIFITVTFVVIGLVFIIWMMKTQLSERYRWGYRALYVLLIGGLLLRPGVPEYQNVEVYTNQYDVYFVVDSTMSMIAEDWEPGTNKTRLDGVKEDIQNLLQEYSGAKFSLIKFDSESASLTTPLTKDATSVMTAVRNLSPELTRSAKGSEPTIGAGTVKDVISRNAEDNPDRARIVFYFGDGETTKTTTSANSYAEVGALVNGGAVYGYGTPEGGKMKIQNGYFITANEGKYIQDPTTGKDGLSIIDESKLNQIATELKVPYMHRSADTPIEYVDLESKIAVDTDTSMNIVNDYSWVLALSLILLISVDTTVILIFLRRTVPEKKVK